MIFFFLSELINTGGAATASALCACFLPEALPAVFLLSLYLKPSSVLLFYASHFRILICPRHPRTGKSSGSMPPFITCIPVNKKPGSSLSEPLGYVIILSCSMHCIFKMLKLKIVIKVIGSRHVRNLPGISSPCRYRSLSHILFSQPNKFRFYSVYSCNSHSTIS